MSLSKVTLQEIADCCRVSKGSVSRALNGDLKHLSPETMERIRRIAGELGYDPDANHDARRLSLRKGGLPILYYTIGLVVSKHFYEANYYQTLLRGVLEELAPTHYGLLLGYMDRGALMQDLPYAFRRDELDAVLLCRREAEIEPLFEDLRRKDKPVVSMIYRIEGCPSVVPDHQMAGYLLMRHLLLQGHRHILHFVPDDASPLEPLGLRLAGYRQAFGELRIDPTSSLHYMVHPYTPYLQQSDLYSCADDTLRMLYAHPEITAVLAPYDEYAGVLIDMLQKHGKGVPEDISVVGLDDTNPVLNRRCENILTTVSMPLRAIGRQAASIALRRISGEEMEDAVITLPVELMERNSTSAPKSALT